jgi:hypothetical protein
MADISEVKLNSDSISLMKYNTFVFYELRNNIRIYSYKGEEFSDFINVNKNKTFCYAQNINFIPLVYEIVENNRKCDVNYRQEINGFEEQSFLVDLTTKAFNFAKTISYSRIEKIQMEIESDEKIHFLIYSDSKIIKEYIIPPKVNIYETMKTLLSNVNTGRNIQIEIWQNEICEFYMKKVKLIYELLPEEYRRR